VFSAATLEDPKGYRSTARCLHCGQVKTGPTEPQLVIIFKKGNTEGSWAHALLPSVLSRPQPFEASDLLLGLNFSQVLSSLVSLNKVTAGESK